MSVATRSLNLQAQETVRLLLRYGADPNAEDKEFVTSLRATAGSRGSNTTEIIELLLDASTDTEMQTILFPTALHRAVIAGKFEAVQYLIERGTNIAINHSKYGISCRMPLKGALQIKIIAMGERNPFLDAR